MNGILVTELVSNNTFDRNFIPRQEGIDKMFISFCIYNVRFRENNIAREVKFAFKYWKLIKNTVKLHK